MWYRHKYWSKWSVFACGRTHRMLHYALLLLFRPSVCLFLWDFNGSDIHCSCISNSQERRSGPWLANKQPHNINLIHYNIMICVTSVRLWQREFDLACPKLSKLSLILILLSRDDKQICVKEWHVCFSVTFNVLAVNKHKRVHSTSE